MRELNTSQLTSDYSKQCNYNVQLCNHYNEQNLNVNLNNIVSKSESKLQLQYGKWHKQYYSWYYLWYFCSLAFLKKRYFLDSCYSEFVLVVDSLLVSHFG